MRVFPVLRPYQEQALRACEEALNSGVHRIGVSLPTGAGKTVVFTTLLSRIKPPTSNVSRALIVVNSIELARQSAEQAQQLFPSWNVEIEQGTKHRASGEADVTVATYQTLLQASRIKKFNPAMLKAVIVDEAHHAAAPSYRRILSHFATEIKSPEPNAQLPILAHKIPIIGFSATFSRHDGLALGSVFERIVYHRDFLEMIKEQWLCDVRFTTVRASLNLSNVTVNSRTGDFNPTSLAHVVNTDTVNNLVVRTWLDKASGRKSTLVFCVNIAHCESLTQTFRGYGIDARYLVSSTPALERKALVTAFKAGQIPVLINCAILTEGADIPNVDCVLVARPTRSRNIFAQMIGRGMRLSPATGKTDCRIIDFVDSAGRVEGLVTIPSLFGLDPDAISNDDETPETLEKRAAETNALDSVDSSIPDPKSVTYKDYEDPLSYFEQAAGGGQHISRFSRNAWVSCGDVHILECLGKGSVRIEAVDDEEGRHFKAHYNPEVDHSTAATLGIGRFLRSRPILTAQTLQDAIHGCDTYVAEKVVLGPMAAGLLRTARWRKAPASEQQKNLVAKRWAKRLLDSEDAREKIDDKIANLTKGEAATIITRMKNGALLRFDKKVTAGKKAAVKKEKEISRRARETVRVGPLEK
ncbi:DEAD-box family helicase [Mycena indigotica]|uniref:DEAD-box family helicase n=1 Tax=Mycena indigotica TaxID=2126181 RepID=A0A8H6SVX3_9AGAR|nr:DEAD-box family helicase [Mycena indigotica]KAF7306883.1 DEAD-box family helicase [Mycena indigotica]